MAQKCQIGYIMRQRGNVNCIFHSSMNMSLITLQSNILLFVPPPSSLPSFISYLFLMTAPPDCLQKKKEKKTINVVSHSSTPPLLLFSLHSLSPYSLFCLMLLSSYILIFNFHTQSHTFPLFSSVSSFARSLSLSPVNHSSPLSSC